MGSNGPAVGFPDIVLLSIPHTTIGTDRMAESLEYRIACNGSGRGHSQHASPKRDLAKATQAAIDANHHAEIHPTSFYTKCAPWSVERRQVTEWESEGEWT